MDRCIVCKTGFPKYVTTTIFGHGDSDHVTKAVCQNCGSEYKSHSNYGLFDDKTLRKAQDSFSKGEIELRKEL